VNQATAPAMPTYTSPEAGDIDAPDGYTAARWLMHRLTHALYGERAIVRAFEAWPVSDTADTWSADAWLGAPRPGWGRLELHGISVYLLDDFLFDLTYPLLEEELTPTTEEPPP